MGKAEIALLLILGLSAISLYNLQSSAEPKQ